MERIRFEHPEEVELKLIDCNGGPQIYIPKELLERPVAAGVFEIDGLPMTLKQYESRRFGVPNHICELLDVAGGDTVTVRMMGYLKRNSLHNAQGETAE